MTRAIKRKLKSNRGSGIAEALVGFLISVLSVLTLLSIATTTLELIKQGDLNLTRLYAEESGMESFVKNGVLPSPGADYGEESMGWMASTYGENTNYTITVEGENKLDPSGTSLELSANVKYCVTAHHHLFGFVPA